MSLQVQVVEESRERQPMVYGPGLKCATVQQRAEFTVDARAVGAAGESLPEVDLFEAGGRELESTVEPLGDNLFRVTYVPQSEGPLTAVVRVAGVPVREQPFCVPVERPHVESAEPLEPQRLVDARTRTIGILVLSCCVLSSASPSRCLLRDRSLRSCLSASTVLSSSILLASPLLSCTD